MWCGEGASFREVSLRERKRGGAGAERGKAVREGDCGIWSLLPPLAMSVLADAVEDDLSDQVHYLVLTVHTSPLPPPSDRPEPSSWSNRIFIRSR